MGRSTNANWIPDSDVADIGFHYMNWGYVNAGDGNALEADRNEDNIVDFEDFAVLAGGWLTDYDVDDLSILAGQWLQFTEPNVALQIVGDGNNGFVEFGADGNFLDTQRVFLLVDGECAGEISGFREGWPLGVDISEYSGGEHQLKAVSINGAGHVTCSNITNTTFSCPLNYCLLPSEYEPNKPLHFSAFNNSSEDVTVEVYADCGNLVWSQVYGGDSFFGSIPAEITREHEIDYVNFDAGGGALLDGGSGGAVSKITDPASPGIPFDVKALIILPNLHIRLLDFRTIWAVQTAFKNRGIKYKKLRGASYYIIALYAATNPIKYMYIDAHGGYGKIIDPDTGVPYYEFDRGILRTWAQLSDGRCFSMKHSDPGVPAWCKHLGFWENRSKSFASMGFCTLEFVYSDGCYGGHLTISNNDLVEGQPGQIGQVYDAPVSDMSIALGMHEPGESRIYHGWYNESISSFPFRTDYQKWSQDVWEGLGEGDSLYDAILYAINQQENLWDPNAPVNAYRLQGQGFVWDIFLSD
jgi:hypothetical protein